MGRRRMRREGGRKGEDISPANMPPRLSLGADHSDIHLFLLVPLPPKHGLSATPCSMLYLLIHVCTFSLSLTILLLYGYLHDISMTSQCRLFVAH